MTSITFIQLGDVHFPEHRNATDLIDHKDKGTSGTLSAIVGSNSLSSAIQELLRFCDSRAEQIGGILV